jgi:hypothetical protein
LRLDREDLGCPSFVVYSDMRLGGGRLRDEDCVEARFRVFFQCSSLTTRLRGVLWLRFLSAGGLSLFGRSSFSALALAGFGLVFVEFSSSFAQTSSIVITPPPCCCHFRTRERTVFVSWTPSGSPMSSGLAFAVPPLLEGRLGVAGDGIGICCREKRPFSKRSCFVAYPKRGLLTSDVTVYSPQRKPEGNLTREVSDQSRIIEGQAFDDLKAFRDHKQSWG